MPTTDLVLQKLLTLLAEVGICMASFWSRFLEIM